MTRVDFYSLEDGSAGDRFVLACRLIERIHTSHGSEPGADAQPAARRVLVHLPEREQARHLDRLLWTYHQQSFLPHGLVGDVDEALTPILIGGDGRPEAEDDVLINLDREVPTFFSRFERLCELVDLDPEVRAQARERFRYYRDRGYPLHHHKIKL